MTVVLPDVLHWESSCHQDLPHYEAVTVSTIFTDHPGWGVSVVLSDLTEACCA